MTSTFSPFTLFLPPSGRRPSTCCPLHSWLTLINVGINLPLTLRRSRYALPLPATSLLNYDLAGRRGGTSPFGEGGGLAPMAEQPPLFYFPSQLFPVWEGQGAPCSVPRRPSHLLLQPRGVTTFGFS